MRKKILDSGKKNHHFSHLITAFIIIFMSGRKVRQLMVLYEIRKIEIFVAFKMKKVNIAFMQGSKLAVVSRILQL